MDIVFIVIGVILVLAASIGFFYRRNIEKNSGQNIATVVYTRSVGDSESENWLALFSHTIDGTEYERELGIGSSERFKEGDEVPIIYHRDKPSNIAIVGDRNKNRIIEAVLFIIGIGIIIFAFGIKDSSVLLEILGD